MEMGAEAADQNRHDQRAARKAEFHGLRHVEQRNRAQQHTEGDADEDRDQIRLVELLERVAQHLGRLLHGLLGTYDHHAVADLEFEALVGDQIDTRTVHARDVHAVLGAQTQIGELLAVDFGTRDEDAARHQFGVRGDVAPVGVVHLDLTAEEGRDGGRILRIGDHPQTVAPADRAPCVGHGDRAVGMHDARDDELALHQVADVLHRAAVDQLVRELDRNLVGELVLLGQGVQRLVLLLELHAQGIADEDHRQDDADHTQRIGHGVTHGDGGIADARGIGIGLLCGTQTGRVGHGAREHAHHGGNRRAGHHVDHVGYRYAQQHDRRGAAHELQTSLLERGEEARADLQTDREDEEYQSELLHEVPDLRIDRHSEMAQRDSDEQNPRDAERYASDPDPAQQDAERDGQGECQNGMRDAVTDK